MRVLFISSIGMIVADPPASRKLYVDALGLPLQRHEGGDYFYTEKIGGSKHFGVWPLSHAAEACCGTTEWPASRPVPQVSIEFEVEDESAVAEGAMELESKGYALLHAVRTEPWGQTIARLQTTDGAIVGISHAPWLHEK